MSRQSVEARYLTSLNTLGKGVLNALYPKDIEYYFLGLELVDSRNRTVDYFAWPVLPDELRESHFEITNIRKTMTAVNTLKNPTFVPRQIFIRGTFGRRFKVILGGSGVEIAGIGLSIRNGKFLITPPNILGQTIPQFSSFVKTGYGCIKMLESMKDKSKRLDNDLKPYSLYLYNPILGNNYQVEFSPGESFIHMQDSDKHNMIPNYTLKLTAVAPLDDVLSRKVNIRSALKNLSIGALQKTGQSIVNSLRRRR